MTVLLAGYLAHFATKAFQLMGEFGYMAPFFAGWLAPLLLIAAVVRALYVIQKKRGLGVRWTTRRTMRTCYFWIRCSWIALPLAMSVPNMSSDGTLGISPPSTTCR